MGAGRGMEKDLRVLLHFKLIVKYSLTIMFEFETCYFWCV